MMRFFLPLAAACLTGQIAMAAPLDLYAWEARPLLVFAPSAEDDRYQAQRQALARSFGSLTERDMAVLLLTGEDEVETLTGQQPEAENFNVSLRQAFRVAEDAFAVVLIGKDGGEKGRWSEPIDPDEIFSIIDSMPMRRSERLRQQ